MGLTRSTARERARTAAAPSDVRGPTRRTERLLLLAATALAAAALLLTLRAKTAPFDATQAALDAGTVVDLRSVDGSADLLPALAGVFADPDDRRLAAEALYAFLVDEDGRVRVLPNVGALSAARVAEPDVAGAEGLTVYRDRLAAARGVWGDETPPERRTLRVLSGGDLRALKPAVVVRTPGDFRARAIAWALAYALAFWAVHVAFSLAGFRGDEVLLPAVHVITGVGLAMMVSLQDPLRDGLLFADYALGVVLGVAVFYGVTRVDFTAPAWRRMQYVPLLLSLLLSVVLVAFGTGPAGSDARINLRLPGLTVQPVEAIKLLLLLFFAGYFARQWRLLRATREPTAGLVMALERVGHRQVAVRPFAAAAAGLVRALRVPRLGYLLPVLVAVGLSLLFFFFQRDLGPALIIATLFLGMYGVARGRWLAVAAGLGALVGAFWLSAAAGYPSTVAQRIELWLRPWDNYIAYGGSHLASGFWALASGGFTGLGPGEGLPATVPQAHTDFILAAIGEEWGFLGLVLVLGAYVGLLARMARTAREAPSPYTFFLALGAVLLLGLQMLLISSGVLGLLPLSGVISPFLNLGKSSMIASFALLGAVASISAQAVPAAQAEVAKETALLWRPARLAVGAVLALFGVLAVRAAWVQVVADEALMVRGVQTVEADGVRRIRYNPRLTAAAARIPRGTVYDRNGLPLATSSDAVLRREADRLARAGAEVRPLLEADGRRYPFGAATFHVLGDLRTRRNMAAENASYVERDERDRLRGYRHLHELIPLVRRDSSSAPVQALLARERDVTLTLDARLQARVADALVRRLEAAGLMRGAAVVLDAETGEVLASVSTPLADDASDADALLDRARYGVYPPGSTFKLVTAIAALQADPEADALRFESRPLPGGGAGARVRGWGRPVREASGMAYGEIAMDEAVAVSSNAYFAQLGTYTVGAERLYRTLRAFGMDSGLPGEPDTTQLARLQDALPQAAIGQGPVLARPLEMARVSATIANGGAMPYVYWTEGEAANLDLSERVLDPDVAARLAAYMRRAVEVGTARALADAVVPAAGKTGTAEVADSRPHAWFTGFAPYGGGARTLAFAVVAEHGGGGGGLAAQISEDLIAAAADLGMF